MVKNPDIRDEMSKKTEMSMIGVFQEVKFNFFQQSTFEKKAQGH